MAPKFEYIQCDIPEGMSIRQWRQERAPRRSRLRVLFARAWRSVRQ
jgi:hypothetical protein